MKAPRAALNNPVIHRKNRLYPLKKKYLVHLTQETNLSSFNQPMGDRNKGVPGIIEHLYVFQ
jgi:hypothetical protein